MIDLQTECRHYLNYCLTQKELSHHTIKAYKVLYKDYLYAGGVFFLNNRKMRLSEQSVRTIIQNLEKQINSDIHITPHKFRPSQSVFAYRQYSLYQYDSSIYLFFSDTALHNKFLPSDMKIFYHCTVRNLTVPRKL